MIQQVNLYQPSTSWEDSALSGALISRLVGGMTALLFVLYVVALVQLFAVKRELGAQLSLGAELDLKLAEFSERASHRVADGTLSSRVTALREHLEAKQRLLETLSQSGDGNSDGFSPHLSGLARQRIDGLWLREIRIGKGGRTLQLAGSALSPEAVPDLLERLGEESVFEGRQFRTFRLEVSDELPGVIDFILATDAEPVS